MGVMLLTLRSASRINSESYKKKHVNVTQKERNLGSVLIYITSEMVTGPSLDSIADCICVKW